MVFVSAYRDEHETALEFEDLTLYDKWNFFLDQTPNKKWQELAYGLEYSKSITMTTFYRGYPVKYKKILLFPYDYINSIVNMDFPPASLIGNNIKITYADYYFKISGYDDNKLNYGNSFENVKHKIDSKGIKIDDATKFMDVKIDQTSLLNYLESASVIDYRLLQSNTAHF
jgi:hypothetical protein